MDEKQQAKRVKKLIAELESREERKVIGALKRVPHEGTPEVIYPMLQLLHTQPSKEVQMLLEKTLFNLKDPNTLDPLINALSDPKLQSIQAEILMCIWQSGLEAQDHLSLLVDLAVEQEYMTGVEVMTIVDNMEAFQDAELSLNIKKLDDALKVKSDKSALLGNLRQILLDKLLS